MIKTCWTDLKVNCYKMWYETLYLVTSYVEKESSKDSSAWSTSMKGLLSTRYYLKCFTCCPHFISQTPVRELLRRPESLTQGNWGLEKLHHQRRAHTASRWQTGMKGPPSATCVCCRNWPGTVCGQSLGSPSTRIRPYLLSLRVSCSFTNYWAKTDKRD